ncbi:MAG TPA: hypothetical protein VLC12_03820 [Terriglobales bacterium]|nr:hypothetical protein [Terriglobales bacterium]
MVQRQRFKITPQWLIDHGCAHDAKAIAIAETAPVDIAITSVRDNWLLRMSPGEYAGFIFWAQFAAKKSAVYIEEVTVKLLGAPDLLFQLLSFPGRGEPYCFPNGEFPMPPADVLNNKFPGTLCQNYPWEGCLMGVAYKRLPQSMGCMAAEITAFDELGHVVGFAEFSMPVCPEELGKGRAAHQGKGLFEPDDMEEDSLLERPLRQEPLVGRVSRNEVGGVRLPHTPISATSLTGERRNKNS